MSLTISSVVDQLTAISTATSALAFTTSGGTGTVTVTGRSLNTAVVASASVVVADLGGGSWTVTVTPVTGAVGAATIELTAEDDDGTVVDTFLLTVAAAGTTWSVPSDWIPQDVGPKEAESNQGKTGSLVYAAPYPDCKTSKPSTGSYIGGLDSDVVVLNVSIDPRTGEDDGMALVTIDLGPPEKSDGGPDATEDPKPTYSRRNVPLIKPLLSHPIYRPAEFGYSEGWKVLTNTDLSQIESWRTEPVASLKAAFKFNDGSGEVTLSSNAQHAARRFLLGEETFTIAAPEVSKTGLTRLNTTAATTVGKWYSAPPGFPSGTFPKTSERGLPLKWIGTEDDSSRQGRTGLWTQTVSFVGVEFVDTDIVPAG